MKRYDLLCITGTIPSNLLVRRFPMSIHKVFVIMLGATYPCIDEITFPFDRKYVSTLPGKLTP